MSFGATPAQERAVTVVARKHWLVKRSLSWTSTDILLIILPKFDFPTGILSYQRLLFPARIAPLEKIRARRIQICYIWFQCFNGTGVIGLFLLKHLLLVFMLMFNFLVNAIPGFCHFIVTEFRITPVVTVYPDFGTTPRHSGNPSLPIQPKWIMMSMNTRIC